MDQLILHLAKSLVDYPEQVQVRVAEEDDTINVSLIVAPEDMGKVIGKQGRIAKAIRTIAKACATKHDKKVFIEIVE